MTVLFKYFTEKSHAESFISGNIIFKRLSEYRKIEDHARVDAQDGTQFVLCSINDKQGLDTNLHPTAEEIKKYTKDSNDVFHFDKTSGGIIIKNPLEHVGTKEIVRFDPFPNDYVLCTSTQLDSKLAEKFGKYVVCFDSNEILQYINISPFMLKMEIANFYFSHILYLNDAEQFFRGISTQYPKLTQFTKALKYKDEYEFRFLIEIKQQEQRMDCINIGFQRKMDSARMIPL